MSDPVHVIGASGRSGVALSRSLQADGIEIVPVVRNLDKWEAAGLAGEPREADLRDLAALEFALRGATRIVSCAHARHASAIIAAAPAEAVLVLLGSTRKFTRWPDAHGNGVIAGENALLASDRRGVMLHPTMIYGAQGEDNVQRLAGLMRKMPVLLLPGGGRFLVQPIHQSDVTRCIRAALDRDWPEARSMVIAGPEPMAYADFARAVGVAAGLGTKRIVSFPAGPMIFVARLAQGVSRHPPVRPNEIRRLLEDKAFDIAEMRQTLGVEPISLAKGLALTFGVSQEK
jgi:nucleoside-diphosphate-sugar epimerase